MYPESNLLALPLVNLEVPYFDLLSSSLMILPEQTNAFQFFKSITT